MANAVLQGASSPEIEAVQIRYLNAHQAGPDDLLWAHGLLLGTPENFGYMSGAVKDFLDRTYYEVEGKLAPLPYALFISAGNDGAGAVRAIQRIARGYPWREIQAPIVARGAVTAAHLAACHELGLALAYGLDAGIY